MPADIPSSGSLPADYPVRIRQFRGRLGLTQVELAARLGVSFATVNRWENGLTKPSPLAWSQILKIDEGDAATAADDAAVEKVAMDLARAYEEAAGAVVTDVHTPELARAAGLNDNPGFDLLSIRAADERRAIEVKGRASTGDVEVTSNEWARAANLRDGYWLYAVYDCATPTPRLMRVQDPFGCLPARAKGSVIITDKHVLEAAGGES